MPQRLLILACSQKKRPEPRLIPAIDRYDGPSFKVLRKFLRECLLEAQSLDIYILSAEFGLITDNQEIPNYDRRMTRERAQHLHSSVMTELQHRIKITSYTELFISVGQDYSKALSGYEAVVPLNRMCRITTGGLGKRLSELHDWLYGKPPDLKYSQTNSSQNRQPSIRGVAITLTPEQIIDIARQAIANGQGAATRYQSWYVSVDEQRVAAKWLVSKLVKLPVSSFVTGDALRLLTQLGIEVRRV